MGYHHGMRDPYNWRDPTSPTYCRPPKQVLPPPPLYPCKYDRVEAHRLVENAPVAQLDRAP